jgi:hypothetical protein
MKFLIPLLVFTLVFPAASFADPPVPETEPDTSVEEASTPKVTGVKKGEKAPYNGVLLNTAAAAKIFAEKEYSGKECELRINFEVQKEMLRMKLLLDTANIGLEATKQKYNSILSIKDKEIERLSKIASTRPNDYSTYWAVGGVVVGIVLSIAVVYGVNEIKN